MKVSDKWSETGIKLMPGGPPLGIIVDGYVLVAVDFFEDSATWQKLEDYDGV
jgi:hypothetical protein